MKKIIKITSTANGQKVITLPKYMVEEIGLDAEDTCQIENVKNSLVIKKNVKK